MVYPLVLMPDIRILRYCVDIFHTLYGSVYLLIKL